MNSITIVLIVSILVFGLVLGFFVTGSRRKHQSQAQSPDSSENDKNQGDSDYAKQLKKLEDKLRAELEVETQTRFLTKQAELQRKEDQMHEHLTQLKETLNQRELFLETKYQQIEQDKAKIDELKNELRGIKEGLLEKKEELESLIATKKEEYSSKIEEVAAYSKKEAKELILKQSKEEMGEDLLDWQHKFLENFEEEAHTKAKEIIGLALQRCSSEVANEFTITTIKLKNEDEKGKIIGKAGRNIQWLEKTLGVELIIDDTPEVITVSGFSSIRRHIAKRTIELLLEDGRIHPSSIEDMHEKAKAEIAQDIADAGQWAVNELGIIDFPAKLTRLIGRLHFRTSYGQNMLKHSVEMAKLAALITNDINTSLPTKKNLLDVDICIKAALLHDIGKGVDEDIKPKTDHITLGERICDTFNLDWRIKKCISSHHDESYYDPEHGFCFEAAIVDACDNLSGGRIGARKETAEAYYQRMNDLEKIADTVPGITKSWIMRGSRELWVFFDTSQVTASQMHDIVKDITKRIETTVNYPGEIKVIGFWEDKVVEYAH